MGAAESLEKKNNHLDTEEQPAILLVDDHHVTADIEHAYFASVGFRVFLASSAADVQGIVRKHKIDLIMVDVDFGRKKGLAVVQAAKRASCNLKIKALVTSMSGAPEIRTKALAGGADGFFTKPAPRPKVLKEIKKMTEQKSRGTERVKQTLSVKCTSEGKTAVATTLDLSGDGVHLSYSSKSAPKPALGASISIAILLEKTDKAIVLEGTVVRHTLDGFGVRFAEMGKMQQRQLDKYLLKFSMEHRASQYYL